MTAPLPDNNLRVKQVAERCLGIGMPKRTYAAAASELNLTVGQISRSMMDYWAWRNDIGQPKPASFPVPVPRVHSGNVKPRSTEVRLPPKPRKLKEAVDIVPPTYDERFKAWANAVIMASRNPRNV